MTEFRGYGGVVRWPMGLFHDYLGKGKRFVEKLEKNLNSCTMF